MLSRHKTRSDGRCVDCPRPGVNICLAGSDWGDGVHCLRESVDARSIMFVQHMFYAIQRWGWPSGNYHTSESALTQRYNIVENALAELESANS